MLCCVAGVHPVGHDVRGWEEGTAHGPEQLLRRGEHLAHPAAAGRHTHRHTHTHARTHTLNHKTTIALLLDC